MPALGRLDTARALEGERASDHTDGQRANLLGDLRHDGGAAGAGAAAHAGGDEDHVRAFQHLYSSSADSSVALRPVSGSPPEPKAAGQLFTNTHARGGLREHQRLGIGVDGHKVNAVQAFVDHAVDGITAAAANTHDLDAGKGFDLVW